ncbi:MAG: LacI family DNA-binding transcriptional regulator [Arachnia sp.]
MSTPVVRNKVASLADVAQLAGVSSQTVSRVVRGSTAVAPDTRQRVLAAVERLGYQPNLAARSLSQRRTGVVHLINATPLFHGHARTYVEVVRALALLGYHTSTAMVPTTGPHLLNRVLPLGVDGVVVLGGHSGSGEWAALAASRVPVVFVGHAQMLPDDVSSVAVNQVSGAREATTYLLETGCRQLLHLCGPPDWVDARKRRDGFLAVCAERGVDYLKLSASSWDASVGYRLAEEIPPQIDGVFASNDQLALGVMRRLHEFGRRIPEDVSVIGFDDADGADCYWPPLTTVRQPLRAIAQAAVTQLASLISGQPAQITVFEPQLVVRASTKGLS